MRIVFSYLQIDGMVLFFGRGPDFDNLPRKGSQILTILTRTSLANENLKVSTPPSDDC